MYKVVIRPQAKEEIKNVAYWYNTGKAGLGKHFTKSIKEKIEIVKKNPSIYQIRYSDVRIIFL